MKVTDIRRLDFKALKAKLFCKKTAFILIAVGVLLLVLTEVLPTTEKSPDTAGITADEYASSLESSLKKLVGSIKGAGHCEVMVTLKNSTEYIYAAETKSSQAEIYGGVGDNAKTETKDGSELKYIIVSDGNGGEKALVVTERLPEVRGAVIVCDGADLPSVRSAVISATTALLGISSNNVCVIKKS